MKKYLLIAAAALSLAAFASAHGRNTRNAADGLCYCSPTLGCHCI